MPTKRALSRANIGPDTPLRLAEAVALAFPAEGMTVSGLRREIARGRLTVETLANKQFTTLAAIEEMRKLYRANAKVPASSVTRDNLGMIIWANAQTDTQITAARELAERLSLAHAAWKAIEP